MHCSINKKNGAISQEKGRVRVGQGTRARKRSVKRFVWSMLRIADIRTAASNMLAKHRTAITPESGGRTQNSQLSGRKPASGATGFRVESFGQASSLRKERPRGRLAKRKKESRDPALFIAAPCPIGNATRLRIGTKNPEHFRQVISICPPPDRVLHSFRWPNRYKNSRHPHFFTIAATQPPLYGAVSVTTPPPLIVLFVLRFVAACELSTTMPMATLIQVMA